MCNLMPKLALDVLKIALRYCDPRQLGTLVEFCGYDRVIAFRYELMDDDCYNDYRSGVEYGYIGGRGKWDYAERLIGLFPNIVLEECAFGALGEGGGGKMSELVVMGNEEMNNFVSWIFHGRKVRNLKFEKCKISRVVIDVVREISGLRKVNFDECDFCDDVYDDENRLSLGNTLENVVIYHKWDGLCWGMNKNGNAVKMRMRDLSLVAGCVNLRRVEIINQYGLSDIGALKGCFHLEELILKYCDVEDIGGLGGNLRRLELVGCCKLRGLEALREYRSLRDVTIGECDVSALIGCVWWRKLVLYDNAALREMGGVEGGEIRDVCIDECPVLNMMPLVKCSKLKCVYVRRLVQPELEHVLIGCVGLKKLSIYKCKLTRMCLKKLIGLKVLNVVMEGSVELELGKNLRRIAVGHYFGKIMNKLVNCVNLVHLELDGSKIGGGIGKDDGECGGLSECRNLKFLKLEDFGIKTLPGLCCKGLERIELIGCENLVEIELVGECENLREIVMCRCWKLLDADMDIVARCKRLRSVEIMMCSISNVDALIGLEELERISFSHSEVVRILGVGIRWKKLRYVDLSGCGKLRGIEGLRECGNLEYVDVSGCHRLHDLSVLAQLPRLCVVNAVNCGDIGLDVSMLGCVLR